MTCGKTDKKTLQITQQELEKVGNHYLTKSGFGNRSKKLISLGDFWKQATKREHLLEAENQTTQRLCFA